MTNSARGVREQTKRLGWLTEAQAALGWGVILLLAALLGTIYLSQASKIAAVGRRIQIQQNELANLKRDNATLERRIAEAQSLEQLQQQAIRLGFVEARPENIEYLIVPDYPAATAESTPLPAATSFPTPPETITEALWLAVQGSIGNLTQGEAGEQ